MHLRRALLLFAVVVGLAALAASISGPARETRRPPPQTHPFERTPRAAPGPKQGAPAQLRFSARGSARTRRLRAGRAAVVTVQASSLGEVSIDGLGLTAPVEPTTPARFDVLVTEPGRHAIRFASATGRERRLVGTLDVIQAGTSSRSGSGKRSREAERSGDER